MRSSTNENENAAQFYVKMKIVCTYMNYLDLGFSFSQEIKPIAFFREKNKISDKKLHFLENFQNPLCLKLADRVQHKGVDGSV